MAMACFVLSSTVRSEWYCASDSGWLWVQVSKDCVCLLCCKELWWSWQKCVTGQRVSIWRDIRTPTQVPLICGIKTKKGETLVGAQVSLEGAQDTLICADGNLQWEPYKAVGWTDVRESQNVTFESWKCFFSKVCCFATFWMGASLSPCDVTKRLRPMAFPICNSIQFWFPFFIPIFPRFTWLVIIQFEQFWFQFLFQIFDLSFLLNSRS